MKNVLKKILIAIFAVMVLFVIIFWNRTHGAFRIYSILNETTHLLNEGSQNYNLLLTGTFNLGNSTDTLNVLINYKKNNIFLTDVKVKQKRYVIKSINDKTEVFMGPSNLIVSAQGPNNGDFDIVKLMGDILKEYPQTSKITNLSFISKLAVSGWAFINCEFYQSEKNGNTMEIIKFPIDSNTVEFAMDENNDNFYLSVDYENKKVKLNLALLEKPASSTVTINQETKTIRIERKELNNAIYRGALRTGGLLLSKLGAPKVKEVEKKFGQGKLIFNNGNRVLLAKGTHKEIGRIEGALLKEEIRKMVDATLYTMCWVYTAKKKSWFIDDFRDAYKRLLPFIPARYQQEMEGMAETSGVPLNEIKLTNVFPALFHCSGFAIYGDATVGGKLYHGRVLDYITDLGLQFSSVLYVINPDGYNAFVNVGYAGFVGSVTGMNDKKISFGEMGGGGEGDWDGMPMAFLMRDGLERANSLQEALDIFGNTPRTCEYYYVIADGNNLDARGLVTTPNKFEIIKPNQFHIKLDEPVKDAVLMSAGNRYKKLAERVKENYGKIDQEKAIQLMDRPVAMKSNLHDALFAPQSLELWVANAGANSIACKEPYTYYKFSDLLKNLDKL